MTNRKTTQKQSVLNALRNNEKGISVNVLRNSFRIGNPYEVIRQLREEGNLIYTNTASDGTTFYRLGEKPTKHMISLLARVFGGKVFTRGAR